LRWHHDPWVVGGALVLAAFYLTVFASDLPKLLLAVAPVVVAVFIGVGLFVRGAWRAWRAVHDRMDELEGSKDENWRKIEALEARLQAYALDEVLNHALDLGWRFTYAQDGLIAESPAGEDENALIGWDELSWRNVAIHLHNTSPHHFPADWKPLAQAEIDQ